MRERERLDATDGDHQEFIGADEGDRWPRGHGGTDQAVAQAVGDVRGLGRNNAQAEQRSRQPGYRGRPPRRVRSRLCVGTRCLSLR